MVLTVYYIRDRSFHENVDRHNHTFVCFTRPKSTSQEAATPYIQISATLPDDYIRICSVDMNNCSEICEEAGIENETIIVFNDGKEVGREPGASADQLEYLVSKALSGLPVCERLTP